MGFNVVQHCELSAFQRVDGGELNRTWANVVEHG